MDYYRIIRDIESGNVANIYTLMGDEPYFTDLITNYFEENFLEESEKAFNQTIVYGRDVTMDQVISTSKGFPMMGEKQLVLVKEAQDLKEWKKSEELSGLEAYLEHPQPATVLVFAFKNKNLDKRLKVSKKLAAKGVVFEGNRIKDEKLPEWIHNFMDQKGYAIRKSACFLLAEYLGSDLGKLVNEITKLSIVVPEGEEITEVHIEENIGISKDYNIFELQKALGVRDVLKANRIINYFADNPKSHPIQMVLPVLYSFFGRLLIHVSDMGSKQSGGWVPPDFHAAARHYPPKKAQKCIGYLRECDRRSKGVDNYGLNNRLLMQELVFKILHC